MEEAGRRHEEHATLSIFSKCSCDVTGDHAGFAESIQLAVVVSLDAILGCDPDCPARILIQHSYPLVHVTSEFTDIVWRARTAILQHSTPICTNPEVTITPDQYRIDRFAVSISRHGKTLKVQTIEGR